MALELECSIVRKMDVINGSSARGPWSKQEFLVQYQDGNYPSNLVLNVWGEDKVKDLAQYQVGDRIKASLTPTSREFNGRWYTDVRAWKIERAAAPAQAAPAPAAAATAPAAPAPVAPAAPAAPEAIDLGDNSTDDLPF